MANADKANYTIDDIYALPEGRRAELVDGAIYDMAPPDRRHQRLVVELSTMIHHYLKSYHAECEIYPAPFAVFLRADNNT